jgi:hypothetical protein
MHVTNPCFCSATPKAPAPQDSVHAATMHATNPCLKPLAPAAPAHRDSVPAAKRQRVIAASKAGGIARPQVAPAPQARRG